MSVVGHARDLIIEGLAARFPAFDGDTVPLSERQRERGREREREREGGRERGRESERVRDRGGQREREREGFVSVVGHARDLIIEGLAARYPAFDGDTVSPSTLLQRGPPTVNP